MKQAAFAAALLCGSSILSGACYGTPDSSLTSSGKGKPEVAASIPATAEQGATVVAEVNVSNPGPGDMESVVLAFSRIGDPDLPDPIVDAGQGGQSEAVASVSPEPVAVSQDGVIYRFAGLAEGDSMQIRFELVLPRSNGEVGNAVLVYDGADPERAKGTRLATTL